MDEIHFKNEYKITHDVGLRFSEGGTWTISADCGNWTPGEGGGVTVERRFEGPTGHAEALAFLLRLIAPKPLEESEWRKYEGTGIPVEA